MIKASPAVDLSARYPAGAAFGMPQQDDSSRTFPTL